MVASSAAKRKGLRTPTKASKPAPKALPPKALPPKAKLASTRPAAKAGHAPAAKRSDIALAKPAVNGRKPAVSPIKAKGKTSTLQVPPASPVASGKPVVPTPKPVVPARGAVPAKVPVATKPLVEAKPATTPPRGAAAAPVDPAANKPKRNGSGLGSRDLQHFADLLLAKRREIVGDMHSMEGEALRSNSSGLSTLPVHMADMGTDNYEQEFTLGLVEKDRLLLREINHALAKITNGSFGICEGTGDPIGKPRLEVQPWARHSIEYARLRERNGRGVRMF